MTITVRTESPTRPDSRALIDASQKALLEVYPPEECFSLSAGELATPNTQFLVARVDGLAQGCVALVDMGQYGEVKRLFVRPEARGMGVGRALMATLEGAARDLGLTCLRLETGRALTAAARLYRASGFRECGTFGQYPEIAACLFMEKRITAPVRQT